MGTSSRAEVVGDSQRELDGDEERAHHGTQTFNDKWDLATSTGGIAGRICNVARVRRLAVHMRQYQTAVIKFQAPLHHWALMGGMGRLIMGLATR
ncbi:unnamed protein product, partial [Prorocentrum cordatum]